MTTNAVLLIDNHHGVYIPQIFGQDLKNNCYRIANFADIDQEDIDILCAGPDHEFYWESWEYILDNIVLLGLKDVRHCLYQNDGDLWAVPEEEIDQISENF
jgi:hypothetical protein